MKKRSCLAIALLSASAFPAEPALQLSMGATITNGFSGKAFAMADKAMNSMGALLKGQVGDDAPPVKFDIRILLEGAGKLTARGKTVRFHVTCDVVDTIADKKVINGVGGCELTSLAGSRALLHFQTLPNVGDRAHV